MEDVLIRITEKPQLKDPVLVEGLPGVGNVGKLAADYLRDQLKALPLASIYSKFLPPQVYVNEEGIIRLVSQELTYRRATKAGERDLIILGGDYQGIPAEGQYELTHQVLQFCAGLGVREVYTL
ncbi:MAG TPA: PAC2 family protein, partial [Thermoplasmata archaeon]